ncbi:hypothetical protein LWI28_001288 [Acer negundo]|uniref:Uncharacterized protein n=1 Tax=Acer negundo TaxID=4023 RepID=A0AAD5NYV9_ACENE|nr:hypothetical protein LWI28_001288 [Acer negundo]
MLSGIGGVLLGHRSPSDPTLRQHVPRLAIVPSELSFPYGVVICRIEPLPLVPLPDSPLPTLTSPTTSFSFLDSCSICNICYNYKEQRTVAEDGVDERCGDGDRSDDTKTCDDAKRCDDADRGATTTISYVPFSLYSDGNGGWRRRRSLSSLPFSLFILFYF